MSSIDITTVSLYRPRGLRGSEVRFTAALYQMRENRTSRLAISIILTEQHTIVCQQKLEFKTYIV